MRDCHKHHNSILMHNLHGFFQLLNMQQLKSHMIKVQKQ